MIKLFTPFVSEEAKRNVQEVLSGTQLAEGPMVVNFENAFAEKYKFKNVVAVNSGTSALELAYELAGIEEGDEVITPVLTCTATNLPILHKKAIPVFTDITSELIIDPVDVEKRITPKTKAIVYVHFGGFAGGLKVIQDIAKKHNLIVIEDAAQSVGNNNIWGTSDFTCISLQAIKTLTSGDGGFLIVKDDNLFKKAKRLRWFGYDREEKQKLGDTDLFEAGYKYQMNDISAAIGLGNLEKIDSLLSKRDLIREYYKYSELPLLLYHWLIILVHPKVDEITKALEKARIFISPHHYRNDKYTIFGGKRKDLPMMDKLEKQYTLLPFHHLITKEEIKYITSIIKKII